MKYPEDKDLFILVLDAGIMHQKDGITFNELKAFIDNKRPPIPDNADYGLLSRLYFDVFFKDQSKKTDLNEKRFLNEEGYFKYLNYKALCEARQASTRSTYLAAIAIFIAVASFLINIFQSCK
jgi:hypothetical protein